MLFEIPKDIADYCAELDAFIEREIKPIEQRDDNIRFFDHRREHARTDWDNQGLPRHEWEQLLKQATRKADAAGHWRFSAPKKYGGKDGSNLWMAVIREHFAAKGLGLHNDLQNEHSIVGNFPFVEMFEQFGTSDDQKQEFILGGFEGKRRTAFGLTEPGSGSDSAGLQTSAVQTDNGWVLNGTKRYITNAPEASIFTVMARTDPVKRGASAISAFIVEKDTPGLSLGKIDKKMGQQGAHTCDVIFDNCRVPAANIIGGKEGVGFKTAMKVLDKGRLHIAAVCVGAAERMLADALAYAMERQQFGQPIAEFQLIQAMLADSKAEIYAARSMVLDAARRRDNKEDISTEASCCKLFASEMCGRVADRSVQIHGGAGYISEYAAERFYRDVRLFRIYEGTTQIQQIVIARNMIKAAQK